MPKRQITECQAANKTTRSDEVLIFFTLLLNYLTLENRHYHSQTVYKTIISKNRLTLMTIYMIYS